MNILQTGLLALPIPAQTLTPPNSGCLKINPLPPPESGKADSSYEYYRSLLEHEQQERERKKQKSHAVHPGSLEAFPGFRYFENTRWLGSLFASCQRPLEQAPRFYINSNSVTLLGSISVPASSCTRYLSGHSTLPTT
jgi:hypothetical protein